MRQKAFAIQSGKLNMRFSESSLVAMVYTSNRMIVHVVMARRTKLMLFSTYICLLGLTNDLHVGFVWSMEIRFSLLKISNWLLPVMPVHWEPSTLTPRVHSIPSWRSQTGPVFCYRCQLRLFTKAVACALPWFSLLVILSFTLWKRSPLRGQQSSSFWSKDCNKWIKAADIAGRLASS